MLPQYPEERDVLNCLLWLVRQKVSTDSVVVFKAGDAALTPRLKPIISRTSSPESLALLEESSPNPHLSSAWRDQSWQSLSLDDSSNGPILPGESSVLIAPIRTLGVIYLGRMEERPFTPEEIAHVLSICQQAYSALSGVTTQQQRQIRSRLAIVQNLLDQVRGTVGLITSLLGAHRPNDVLEAAGAGLSIIADFDHWAIIIHPTPKFEAVYLTNDSDSLDSKAVHKLAKTFSSPSGHILCNMPKLSYELPTPETRASMVCPLITAAEGKPIGSILLFSSKRDYFSVQEQSLLSTFALSLGSIYWTLRLHDELKHSQTQLVQSSKMAAVGQLAAGVAHELNSPLGAISLAVQGAQKYLESHPDRAKTRLELASSSCERLQRIVSKLLQYSHSRDSEDEEADLNEVITTTLNLVQHQLDMEYINVTTDLEDDMPLVRAKSNELQQVVLNLINNSKDAIVAADPVKREIEIRTRAGPQFVALSLSDDGVGMESSTLARVFEPFFTTKQVGHGTGLGLSIAKELVEKYGGSIDIRSVPGHGTRFLLRFARFDFEPNPTSS